MTADEWAGVAAMCVSLAALAFLRFHGPKPPDDDPDRAWREWQEDKNA